jgi:hypothetical protein
MGLTTADLAVVEHIVAGAANARGAASILRTLMPQLRVSVQDAFDLRGETPVVRTAGVDVHLMASDGPCWSLTATPETATALLLSDREAGR